MSSITEDSNIRSWCGNGLTREELEELTSAKAEINNTEINWCEAYRLLCEFSKKLDEAIKSYNEVYDRLKEKYGKEGDAE